MSLSSPGHTVSPFRRARFWEAFSVRNRGASQSQFHVRKEPRSCKIFYFLYVLDATFDTEDHTNAGQKTLSLSSPGMLFPRFGGRVFGKPFRSEVEVHLKAWPCCFPVSEGAFLGSLFGQKSRCISKPIPGAEGSPEAAKSSIFYRFWTRRLTLKITHSQVKKRCP